MIFHCCSRNTPKRNRMILAAQLRCHATTQVTIAEVGLTTVHGAVVVVAEVDSDRTVITAAGDGMQLLFLLLWKKEQCLSR